MTDWTPRKPTPEECSANAQIAPEMWAAWYPQMGGYIGMAVLRIWADTSNNECFEVWVWHDGEFPFSDDGQESPAHLHHCDAEQFIRLGEFVLSKRGSDALRAERSGSPPNWKSSEKVKDARRTVCAEAATDDRGDWATMVDTLCEAAFEAGKEAVLSSLREPPLEEAFDALGWLHRSSAHPHEAEILERVETLRAALINAPKESTSSLREQEPVAWAIAVSVGGKLNIAGLYARKETGERQFERDILAKRLSVFPLYASPSASSLREERAATEGGA